jgi:broad specificity phosphatase PhoE
MKIHIIRHGETDSNKAKRLMGQRIDESLNNDGLKQVQDLASKLHEREYDVIFASPLKRAVQTAEMICKNGTVQILQREELKERDFGTLSGKTWEEIDLEMQTEPGAIARKDFNQEYDYTPYEGETAEDVKVRFLKFVNELKSDFNDKKVIIVAHGGILRIAHFLFNNAKIGHIENTAVVECEI